MDKERLKEYLREIQEVNPEIVAYIGRTAQMIDVIQMMRMDCSWFATVAMILMYKSLEREYAKLT